MKDKKAQQGIVSIIWFIAILFLLVITGLGLAFGSMVVNWVWDEAVPELTSIGVVDNTNMTAIGKSTIGPANNFIQSWTWLAGVVYIMALLGCLGFAVAFRFTGNKWLGAFFVLAMVLLIMGCIFVSNIYEEFYSDNNEVGLRLKEHTLLSFLLLQSPLIMTVIGFIGGVIMFSGDPTTGGI